VPPQNQEDEGERQEREQENQQLLGDDQVAQRLVQPGRQQERDGHVPRPAVVGAIEERRIEDAGLRQPGQAHPDARRRIDHVLVVDMGQSQRADRENDHRREAGQREAPDEPQQGLRRQSRRERGLSRDQDAARSLTRRTVPRSAEHAAMAAPPPPARAQPVDQPELASVSVRNRDLDLARRRRVSSPALTLSGFGSS
jgi:hypothetical protein